jgi:hypothetical protein
MRLQWIAVVVLGLYGCSSDANSGNGRPSGEAMAGGTSPGGAAGSRNPGTGGGESSGVQNGGRSAGGPTSGGTPGTSSGGVNGDPGGKTASGGTSLGAGGASPNTGGSNAGASNAGGSNVGGSNSGGSNTGGSAGAIGGGAQWKPAKNTTFYWDLQSAPPNNGRNVGAYDIDGWNNDANEVGALHARGIKVVCYMDAGTFEPGRPDSGDFPAGLKGAGVDGWPGELWLDVRPSGPNYSKLQQIMLARFTVCKQKGFDAVEPDNMDSYQNDPGFSTTAADQLAYNKWLASAAHGLGLAIFQKNDLDQVEALEPYFDGILDEECNKYSECEMLAPYTAAAKPAWDAEYTEDGQTTAKFCAADAKANIVGALFGLDLDGKVFEPCPDDVGIVN